VKLFNSRTGRAVLVSVAGKALEGGRQRWEKEKGEAHDTKELWMDSRIKKLGDEAMPGKKGRKGQRKMPSCGREGEVY